MIVNFYRKSEVRKGGAVKTEKEKKTEETYIDLRARYDGELLIYNTGLKTTEKEWDRSKKRFRPQSNRQGLNKYLDFLETTLKDLYLQNKMKGIVLPGQQFREQLKQHLVRNSRKGKTLLNYFQQDFIEAKYIKASPTERVVNTTVARYKVVIKHLEIYQNSKNVTLTFDSMTKEFYNDFVNFFTHKYTYIEKKKTIVGLEDSTIGNTIKSLKVFLKWAQEEGLHSNEAYKKFKVLKPEDEQIITLSDDEYRKLLDVDLSDSEKLQQVRDIFIVGAAVGARVSDLLVLKQENAVFREGRYFVEYLPKKTRKHRLKPLSVPVISSEAVAVIKKYEGRIETLLPAISDVKLNKHLKELGRRAKIDEKLNRTKTQGGRMIVVETVPKWKLLSSHAMRKTFITRALKAGMPAELVMECSGHSDYKSFQRYIDMSDAKYKAETFEKYIRKTNNMTIAA